MAGVPSYQRKLGAEVRDLTLKEIKKILLDKKHETYPQDFRGQVILRLAGNVLPRINEHMGEDGSPIKIIFDKTFNDITPGAKESNKLAGKI